MTRPDGPGTPGPKGEPAGDGPVGEPSESQADADHPAPVRFGEILFAAFLCIVGAAAGLRAVDLGFGSGTPMGAGSAPFALGVGLVGTGLLILTGAIARYMRQNRLSPEGKIHATAWSLRARISAFQGGEGRRIALIYGLLLIGMLLSLVVGLIAGALFSVVGIGLLVERMRMRELLILTAVTGVVLWALFVEFLAIPVPSPFR